MNSIDKKEIRLIRRVGEGDKNRIRERWTGRRENNRGKGRREEQEREIKPVVCDQMLFPFLLRNNDLLSVD